MKKVIKCSLICSLFSVLLLTGCQEQEKKVAQSKAIPVHTAIAQSTVQPYWIDVFGQTEGNQAVLVYPQVTGPILSRNYQEGHEVKKDDILFTIDPAPFQAAYRSAQASTLQAKANLDKATREAKRYTSLHKANAVSEKEYTDALSEYEVCKANLAAAKAKEEEAFITLGYTKIRSPVNGIAGRALVNPGTLVQAHATQLTDVTQENHLKVRFSLSDHDMHGYTVTDKSPVEVIFDKSNKPIEGKINFTAVQVDPKTGTRSLSADLPAQTEILPGQYVTVRLTLGEQKNVFLVPQKSIRQLSDGTYSVYVLRDNKARAVPVTVGKWIGTDWVVTGGLKNGDEIILDNIQRLKDKAPVKKIENKPQTKEA